MATMTGRFRNPAVHRLHWTEQFPEIDPSSDDFGCTRRQFDVLFTCRRRGKLVREQAPTDPMPKMDQDEMESWRAQVISTVLNEEQNDSLPALTSRSPKNPRTKSGWTSQLDEDSPSSPDQPNTMPSIGQNFRMQCLPPYMIKRDFARSHAAPKPNNAPTIGIVPRLRKIPATSTWEPSPRLASTSIHESKRGSLTDRTATGGPGYAIRFYTARRP
mmetsp:Transcript_43917/g.117256  ORF Transcript_43917/g.117256 Transcript_43917/m.117256 type:complete len:216 (-) Transcript_43917:82-729(-)